MTTKFNQGMYARMRAKKNDPLSNLGTKGVRVMENGILVTTATPSTPAVKSMRTTSPATSIEKIPPQRNKRQRTGDKQKEKVNSWSSNIWDDVEVQARAQDIFIADDMKVFSRVSANEVVGHHLHKLVQVLYKCDLTFFFLLCRL